MTGRGLSGAPDISGPCIIKMMLLCRRGSREEERLGVKFDGISQTGAAREDDFCGYYL